MRLRERHRHISFVDTFTFYNLLFYYNAYLDYKYT